MNLIVLLNIVGLFRTIVVLLAIYFLIRLFTRYVLPLIVANKIKQMQQDMNRRNPKQYQTNRHEGDVTIDYGSQQSNNTRKAQEGEYIDFEEVD